MGKRANYSAYIINSKFILMYIKESNYWAIHDAFLLQQDLRVSGTKLQALHRLIQKKGELKTFNENEIKWLNLGGGTYIAMDIQSYSDTSFFPCKVKKYHVQELNFSKN